MSVWRMFTLSLSLICAVIWNPDYVIVGEITHDNDQTKRTADSTGVHYCKNKIKTPLLLATEAQRKGNGGHKLSVLISYTGYVLHMHIYLV